MISLLLILSVYLIPWIILFAILLKPKPQLHFIIKDDLTPLSGVKINYNGEWITVKQNNLQEKNNGERDLHKN